MTSRRKEGEHGLIKYINNQMKKPELNLPASVMSRVWKYIHDILYLYCDGLVAIILSRTRIKNICDRISHSIDQLRENCDDKDHLFISIWIGSTVESWVLKSIELEEYEMAENLSNILNWRY